MLKTKTTVLAVLAAMTAIGCANEVGKVELAHEAIDSGPPPVDAGQPEVDSGPPPSDAGPPPTDAGPPPSDAGVGCTLTQGYWKNHPEDWPVTTLVIGGVTYTQTQLLAILRTPPRGDASLILAHQLIAAMLNVANGASSATIGTTITNANAFLAGLGGTLFTIDLFPGATGRDLAIAYAARLARFNEGLTSVPHCPD